jgi:hypothetical protein
MCMFIINRIILFTRSRDSAVGIATGYGLDGRGVGVRLPVGPRFSLLRVVQTGSGAHPASWCRGQEYADLYIHFHIRLHGVVLH